MTPNIDILLRLIELKSLKIISFDIFDTLLTRPVLNPTDILVLLDSCFHEIIDKRGNKISKIRIDCENELIRERGVENVTIDLIYRKIKNRTNLDSKIINNIKKKEISLEMDLLEINNEVHNILLNAKMNKKKIILTSDMYFTSKYIALFLDKFHIEYDSLYISANFKKRKDKGDLFDEIIYIEKILPSEMLHIGDNINSDYIIPLKKGILSFHYNSSYIKERKNILFESQNNKNEITSIFLGYLLTKENNLVSKENMKFMNIYDFGYYFLGPILLSMMLHILLSKKIQNKYDILFFSSRDGYLPMKVYELLRNITAKGIPGRYIYCGRRAINIAYYDNNVFDYLSNNKNKMKKIYHKNNFDISEFFSYMNIDKGLYKENHSDNIENIEDYIIDKNSVSIEFDARKKNASKYFNNMLKGIRKGIIFDCGYSGSVSDSIYRLTKKRVDKIYMWEEEKNKYVDKKNDTKTYTFFNNYLSILPFNLIFEELFSPAEGTCIGYEKINGELQPVLDEDEVFSDIMKNDLAVIHEAVLDYVKEFCLHFNKYLLFFDCIDCQKVFNYATKHLFNERDESINLFSNISFYDKTNEGKYLYSLTNKLILKNNQNSCKGNILLNTDILHIKKSNMLSNKMNIKIGIHLHMFYIEQYIEFLEKLIEFPYPFDLFITYSDTAYIKILSICFSSKIIKNLKKLSLIIAKNRGRDIGSWLMEIKKYHMEYDIFGHFHTKKNNDIGFGDKWRNYLIANLLKENAVIDIINLFYNNEKLGIVYPPMFKNVYSVLKSVGDPPFQELNIVNEYLKKINLPSINNCNEIPFSVGTMFWYRPKALKKLFLENLSYNDFPEEPIGINGTLAHAIERLPSYIANNAGYDTELYINPEILTNTFYNSYQEQIILNSYHSIKVERDQLIGERNGLIHERNGLIHERSELINVQNELYNVRDKLINVRDELVEDKARIESERDILLNSRSWRFTKPLRNLGIFIRRHKMLRLFVKVLLYIKRKVIK